MQLTTTVRACPEVMIAQVQGESVLLQVESGEYFGLNKVGSRIWQLIGSPKRLQDVVEALLLEFEGSREQVEVDVVRIVEELHAAALARVCGPGDNLSGK